MIMAGPKLPDLPNVPWITADGCIDLTKVPLDDLLARAISSDRGDARAAIGVLGAIAHAGRREAAVYLLGLLADLQGDDLATLELRGRVVEKLSDYRTASCAAMLFGEFRRVTSSNTTRRYLNTVIKTLSRFPPELVEKGFDELATDKRFTPIMRDKFLRAAGKAVDNAVDALF